MQRIEGLSIGLSLDSIKVESGLKDLKRQLGLVNSEMKANLSAFDKSEQSTEKYRVKLDGLNKRLEVQRTIVEKARDRHEKMVKEFGEGSKEAENAAREYNNQAAKLNDLERYIRNVTDEMREFQKQQKIQNSTLFKAGDSLVNFGNGLKSVSDKVKGVGKSLTTKLTLPAVGAASALAGIALKKGFDRLVGIDNARAKLQGLGHDAEGVEKIMASALDSVRGTSFGMDEAATTAANAVAAGIKPGKELTRYLSLTGDAAAIAGVNMGEMGSILNKVKTSNKAYNGELQQLADRGLPVYQWLAKEAGVAEDQVFDLAKNGKISSEMLMNAIEKNIGGAAKKMGETSFTAGISNMWAAVGRLGASFLDAGGKGGGFFSTLKPLISDFTERIDSMGEFAEKAGVKFGEMFTGFIDKIKSVKSWFDDLSPSMQDIIKKGALIGTVVAVGIGPALMALGSLGGVIANISIAFGTFSKFLAPIMTSFKGIAPIAAEGAKSVGLLGRVFGLLTGPVGITIGIVAALTTGFILLYKRSETFREGVQKLVGGLKELGGKVFGHLKDGLGAVASFFKEQLSFISGVWESEGGSFLKVAEFIGNVIVKTFQGILKVIDFVMPAVLAVIKSVWGNIKGVIEGAIKVITGVIQVFSGLFTGDFKKMWEGVKNIFKGALQFVWNYVQLMFWGKMLKGILNLGKLLFNAFRNSWKNISGTVSKLVKTIVDFVKDRFTKSRNTVKGILEKLRDIARNIWNGIKDRIVDVLKTIYNSIRTRFSNARDLVKNIFDKLKEITKNAWNTIKNRIVDPVKSAVSSIRDRFTNMRKAVSDIFSKTRDKVRDYVSGMVKTVKDMPGKMAKGIKDMGYKLYDSAKGVANRLVKGLGKGVNGVIGGVNWVLGKLNVKTKLEKWTVPEYARGTKGHPHDGPAIVGDGTGRLKGRELVQTPDGQSYLSPAKPTLVNLPKGTQVFSALETKSLLGDVPKYARGTGGMVKSGLNKLKDVALNVWSYASNPGKLLDLALTTLGIKKPDNSNLVGKIARGGFNMIKSNAVDYVKSMFAKAEEAGGNLTKPNFGGRFRFTSGFGMRWGRLHGGVDYAAPEGTPIPSQSGGRVSFASYGWNGGFGNLVRVKQGIYEHYYAHMSRILTKVGQAVKRGDILGLVGNTGDSKGAHVHYEIRKNGVRLDPHKVGSGYFATGGLIKRPGLYGLAEGGYPEYVIPTDPKRRTDAMKLLALAGRDVAGNKRPHQLPNVGGQDTNVMVQLLDATLEQNRILMQLLRKDTSVVIDEDALKNSVNRRNALDGLGAYF